MKFVKENKRSQHFFSNKLKSKEKITLAENDEIIPSDIKVGKTFQNFFSSIVKNLNIQRDETHLYKITQDNPVLVCTGTFSKHPGIVCIKKTVWKQPVTNSFLNMNKERNILQKFKILTLENLRNKLIYL